MKFVSHKSDRKFKTYPDESGGEMINMSKITIFTKITMAFLLVLINAIAVFSDKEMDKLLSEGKYREAVEYADKSIPASDRTAMHWIKIAKANDALGFTEKALACYLVSWRMNPDDFNALVGAARVYNNLQQPDNAINMAKKALEMNFTAEASWEYARACIALKRPAEAKKALEKVIKSDIENLVANRELGNIYINEKEWARAVPLLKKAYIAQKSSDLAYKTGMAYCEIGAADSAVVYLKKSIEMKGPPEAVKYLACAFFYKKEYGKALNEYSKVSPDMLTAQDYYRIAVSKDYTADNENAIMAYQTAVTEFGAETSKEALWARAKTGDFFLSKGNYQKALEQFGFIVNADQQGKVVPQGCFKLAEAYQGLGDNKKAISTLQKAISLDKKNFEAYARLADLYQKNGMNDKAEQTYRVMMEISPDDPDVYLVLGKYNLNAKKYSEALNMFQKSNSLKNSGNALEGIAVCAFNLKKYDDAYRAAESALKLDMNFRDARMVMVSVLMNRGDCKNAQKHLEALLKKEPDNIGILKQAAVCLQKNNQKKKLLEVDKRIVALDSRNVRSRMRLAEYADSVGDTKKALKYYKELALLQPDTAEIVRKLYQLFSKNGDKEKAVEYVNKFINLKPDDASAYRDLGDLMYESKKLDSALEAYRTALKKDPSIKGFYKRYADIVIAKGQQDEVIKALTKVIDANEAEIGTYTTLGMIYQQKKKYPEAVDMYQKALKIDPSNLDALSATASCQAENGDLKDAVISYEQVIMMNPQVKEEYRLLGELYLKLGRHQEGMQKFKEYLEKGERDESIVQIVAKHAFDNKMYADVIKYLDRLGSNISENQVSMYTESGFSLKEYKVVTDFLEKVKDNDKLNKQTRNEAYKKLSEAYEMSGNDSMAAKAYGEYILLPGVNDKDAAYKHAFFVQKTDESKARNIYEKNIKKYPQDHRNFLELGLIYSKNKEMYKKAVDMLQRVTEMAGSVPQVWLEMARIYGEIGDEENEFRACEKYLDKDPQNPEANKRIGILLMKKSEHNKAMVHLELANNLSAEDPLVMSMLAKGYNHSGRTNEALDLLLKARELKKEDPQIMFQLFEVYQKLGKMDKALKEMEKLTALDRDTKYLLIYAEALMIHGKNRESEDVIEDILAVEATNTDALLLKAKNLRSRKKYNEAIEVYKEISYFDPENVAVMLERAETHLLQSKPQWAETFFKRALKADPDCAMAEFGLAKIAKAFKDSQKYKKHLENAAKLAPDNELILEEIKRLK